MIEKIIDGIVAALLEEFPDVKVYTEQIKQGLTEPCFIVRLINPTSEQFLGNRYYRTNMFSIQYIPKSTDDAKAECYGVTEALFGALEYINVGGDMKRGTGMRSEYFDGVMTFLVNFNMYVKLETALDPMETLTVENQAK